MRPGIFPIDGRARRKAGPAAVGPGHPDRMGLTEILLIGFVVTALVLAGLWFLLHRKPEALEPVVRFAMRSKRLRRAAERRTAEQLAADPSALSEQVERIAGRDAARQLESALATRNEAERERILKAAISAANEGKQLDPSVLQGQPGSGARTPEQLRARNKAKSKARAKAKQARRQRKRARKKRR